MTRATQGRNSGTLNVVGNSRTGKTSILSAKCRGLVSGYVMDLHGIYPLLRQLHFIHTSGRFTKKVCANCLHPGVVCSPGSTKRYENFLHFRSCRAVGEIFHLLRRQPSFVKGPDGSLRSHLPARGLTFLLIPFCCCGRERAAIKSP